MNDICSLLKVAIFFLLIGGGLWIGLKFGGTVGSIIGGIIGILLSSQVVKLITC